MRKNRFLLVLLVSTISCQSNEVPDIYQKGDVPFQDFEFRNSAALRLIYKLKYSRMPMIVIFFIPWGHSSILDVRLHTICS